MKPAVIFAVQANANRHFRWRWRAADGTDTARESFFYFYECIQDARRHGYDCRFEDRRFDQPPAGDPSLCHVDGEAEADENRTPTRTSS